MRVALLLLVGAATACKPTILYFRAQPNVICAGHSSRLTWSASARCTITDTATGAIVANDGKTGGAAMSPTQQTTYRLNAHSVLGTTSREAGVTVISTPEPHELGASMADPTARCVDSVVSVVVHADPMWWDARLVAGTVHGLGNRPLRVEHGDVHADVPLDGATNLFSSVPVQGDWLISSPLLPGEQCGVRTPRNLAVQIRPLCSP